MSDWARGCVLRYDGDHIKMSSETALMKTPAVNIFFVFKQREIFLCVYNNNIYFYVDILFFFFFILFLFFTINIKIYFKLKKSKIFFMHFKNNHIWKGAAERRIFLTFAKLKIRSRFQFALQDQLQNKERLSLLKFHF